RCGGLVWQTRPQPDCRNPKGGSGGVSGTLTKGAGRTPSAKTPGRSECSSRNVRHDQPVRHTRLEMLEYAGLASRHADRQRLAACHPKLDDIGPVALGAVDHDAISAAFRRHTHRQRSFDQSFSASRFTAEKARFFNGDPTGAVFALKMRCLAGSSVRQCREVGVVLCDPALDARAADGGPGQNLGPMQGPMIQDQSVTGRELGRDAGGGRKISGDPLVWKLSVVRRRKRKTGHARMRPAHDLDGGLIYPDRRERKPNDVARIVTARAAAVIVRVPFETDRLQVHAADAAMDGEKI